MIVPGEFTEVETLNLLWRTSIDIIGESSLGYPFQCLKLDEPNLYAESVKNLLYAFLYLSKVFTYLIFTSPTIQKLALLLPLLPYVMQFGSPGFRRRIIDLVPWRGVRELKGLIDTIQSKGESVLRNSSHPVSESISTTHDPKSIIALICRSLQSSTTKADVF